MVSNRCEKWRRIGRAAVLDIGRERSYERRKDVWRDIDRMNDESAGCESTA
jgi:hypothetical protein